MIHWFWTTVVMATLRAWNGCPRTFTAIVKIVKKAETRPASSSERSGREGGGLLIVVIGPP
jgi:hypothetical protein